MALRGFYGFGFAPVLLPGQSLSGTSPTYAVQAGIVTGNTDVRLDSSSAASTIVATPGISGTAIFGWSQLAINGQGIFETRADAGGTSHVSVVFDNLARPIIQRGAGGATLATAANSLVFGARYYFELKVTIADAGGIAVLRCNNVEIINFVGDTKNGGTSTLIDACRFSTGNATFVCGNFTWRDTTGSSPYNDFMGEQVVLTLQPNGNGAVSQFVGTDGNSVDNYLLVDETPPNITDYVSSPTAGQQDLYTFDDTALGGTVHAVNVRAYNSKSDAGARSIKLLERSGGGTLFTGPTQIISTAWQIAESGILLTDADGTAWNVTKVNALQGGVENV
jgi:hypothetical protein